MLKWKAYWRLARFDKPVGILLLWYPTAWALWLANHGAPSLKLFVLFLLGTTLMRTAGCIINDIADRHLDKHVARTASRPLTSGEVDLKEAFALLFIFLFGALVVLINLPEPCIYAGIIAVLITFIYPFCKRYIDAPQIVLGLAFSMGIPMAYSASGAPIDTAFYLLFLLNFLWIIAYDTMYAMADKADDIRIGIKSTAIYFADYDRVIITSLHVCIHTLWLLLCYKQKLNPAFYAIWLIAGGVLIWQLKLIHHRQPKDCFRAFLSNSYYGALMWFALIAGCALSTPL